MVLAGIEFIFFIETHMMLCFGFLMTIMLIAHQFLAVAEQGSHRAKDFQLLVLPCQQGT